MNLYVPLGHAPDLGRKRPYKIGEPADVATAQNMYPSITPPMRKPTSHAKTEEGEHGPRIPSQPLVTPQHHLGVLAGFRPPGLKCCGVVQRQLGWPTP